MDITATCGSSAPYPRCFLRRGRCKAVVDEALGDEFAGALVSYFYAAGHHCDGPMQRCWAHLLRDTRHQRMLYPDDHSRARCADAVHDVYAKAKALTHPSERQRRAVQPALEHRLLPPCRPCLADPTSAQAKLCRRVERHIKSLPRTRRGALFVFVADPDAPPDNSAAERRLRPLVTIRKVNGGTPSPQGADTKMTLASIFGSWRAQGLNSLTTCRQPIPSPQP